MTRPEPGPLSATVGLAVGPVRMVTTLALSATSYLKPLAINRHSIRRFCTRIMLLDATNCGMAQRNSLAYSAQDVRSSWSRLCQHTSKSPQLSLTSQLVPLHSQDLRKHEYSATVRDTHFLRCCAAGGERVECIG